MRRLLAALWLLFPLAAQAGNLATTPLDRLYLPWWGAQFTQSLAQAKADPEARVVWLGDSITFYWQRHGGHGYDDILPLWNQYYAPYDALDFGFIGDPTSSLLWRLNHGQVAGLHPKLAIILIGANNLGRLHWDATMTIPGIEAVVADTHARLPHAHILLLGVLPSIRSPWVDAQTAIINPALASRYAASPNVTFINVNACLLKNGAPDASLFVDPQLNPPAPPIHPNETGMACIANAIQPLVAEYAGVGRK